MSLSLRRVATAAALAALLAGCRTAAPGGALGVPLNYASHELCGAAFLAGIDPGRAFAQGIAPELAPLGPLIRYRIDPATRTVTARLPGLGASRATAREGAGCVVDQGRMPPPLEAPAPRPAASLLAPIAGPGVVAPKDQPLAAALDHAFAEPAHGPHRWTHAVVILRHGRVIAERYAPGYGPQTRLHGWSMTKSAMNALLGVLVRQGRLEMNAPAPVAAWADPADPRRRITPNNLLRMTSGLAFGQSLTSDWKSAFDPSTQMNFAVPDMAAAAVRAPLAAAPGAVWRYSNGNTAVLGRIVSERLGGPAAVQAFARRELFDKLGMGQVVLETDATGAPIGGIGMWASARDWARLGLLYLHDGVVGRERLLPEGWAAYTARLTPGSEAFGYGAGFWTNAPSAGARFRPHMPADSFMARGSHGQYVIVIPSADVVIVQLGDAFTPRGDIDAVDRLTGEVLDALKAP